jgi:hypothetical protein
VGVPVKRAHVMPCRDGGGPGLHHVGRDAQPPADPDGFQVTGAHQAVHGLFRHPKDRRGLEDGQIPSACQGRSVAVHGASRSAMPVARQILLQLSRGDIGQLTDIERQQLASSAPAAEHVPVRSHRYGSVPQ